MKTAQHILLSFLFALCMTTLAAQTTTGLNYQAVLRSNTFQPIGNQSGVATLSIVTTTGAELYREIHTINTDHLGLFNLVIGRGAALNGNFAALDWGSGGRLLKITVAVAGNTYDFATIELQAVPYAKVAERVLQSTDNQTLSISGTNLSISNGNTVVLPAGPAGPKGDKGEKGDKGDTGAMGATGTQGVAGAQGAKGDTGATGAVGSQGPTGPKGDKGEKGDKGDTGSTGAAGPQGAAGAQGAKGDTGATGAVGSQGPTGPKGDKGDKGDTGAPGAVGPQGPAGTYTAGPGISINNGVLSNTGDGDNNATNELQTLSLNGNQLSISNRNTVTLPAGANSWSTNANHISNTNTGNVGIGTDDPIAKLQIAGSNSEQDGLAIFGGNYQYAVHLDPGKATAALGIHPIDPFTAGIEVETGLQLAMSVKSQGGTAASFSNAPNSRGSATVSITNSGTAPTYALNILSEKFENDAPLITARHRQRSAVIQLTSRVNSPSSIIFDNDNGFTPGLWRIDADGQRDVMIFAHNRFNDAGGGTTARFPLTLTPNFTGINELSPQHSLDVAGIVRAQGSFHVGMHGLLWEANLGRNTHGAGQLELRNPANAGGSNLVLGTVGNANRGSIALLSNGTIKAQMYLDNSNRGILTAEVKNFSMDHPKHADQEIWYACIEGPEAAAYERGTATLKNGRVSVTFSEHFENVINPQTITVQLTPLSADSKGLAVVEKTATGFTVREMFQGQGNYQFDWEVKGVRKGFENYQAVRSKQAIERPALLQMASEKQ
ncbi:MAG TPA: hypothetical protein PLE32_07765 [Haliscomenobacter sp.]|nr:hypothetical protein [Haliscomenobacter sp.]